MTDGHVDYGKFTRMAAGTHSAATVLNVDDCPKFEVTTTGCMYIWQEPSKCMVLTPREAEELRRFLNRQHTKARNAK